MHALGSDVSIADCQDGRRCVIERCHIERGVVKIHEVLLIDPVVFASDVEPCNEDPILNNTTVLHTIGK